MHETKTYEELKNDIEIYSYQSKAKQQETRSFLNEILKLKDVKFLSLQERIYSNN